MTDTNTSELLARLQDAVCREVCRQCSIGAGEAHVEADTSLFQINAAIDQVALADAIQGAVSTFPKNTGSGGARSRLLTAARAQRKAHSRAKNPTVRVSADDIVLALSEDKSGSMKADETVLDDIGQRVADHSGNADGSPKHTLIFLAAKAGARHAIEALSPKVSEQVAGEDGRFGWARQELVKTIINAMVEASGNVKAVPAGKAADHILAYLAPALSSPPTLDPKRVAKIIEPAAFGEDWQMFYIDELGMKADQQRALAKANEIISLLPAEKGRT